jgi:hypothetical protein
VVADGGGGGGVHELEALQVEEVTSAVEAARGARRSQSQ